MKKFFGFVLSAIFVLQSIVIVNAKSSDYEDYDMAVSALIKAGIVTLNSDGVIDEENIVTRAEFSEYVGKMLNIIPDYSMQYFKDVPKDHEQAYYINPLTDVGVISFNDAKIFEPDRAIKYSEACKMLLCAMGYSDYALLKGASMTTWVNVAAETGIAVEVLDVNGICEKEAIMMMFNAMKAPVMKKVNGVMETDEGSNLFSEHHNIYFAQGVVQATENTYLERFSLQRTGYAIVSGEEFMTELPLTEYLGAEIEYAYLYDSKNDEGTIFYAGLKDEEDILTINGDLFKDYNSQTSTIYYYADENTSKMKNEDLEKTMQIIYNGVPFKGTVDEATKGFLSGERRGVITLTDSDSNGKYDILNIKNYEVFPSATIDTLNESIYGGFEKSTINYADFDSVKLYNEEGVEKELAGTSGAILNIARSFNGEVLEIIFCTESKEINVASVQADENEITADDGKVYKVDFRVMEENKNSLLSYKSARVYFDAFGYIVKIQKGSTDGYSVGYLIKGRGFEDDSSGYTVNLEMYTKDAKINTFKLAEKVKIDEISYNLLKNPEAALNAIPESSKEGNYYKISPQVIRYKLDNEGFIAAIDTVNLSANEDKFNSLRLRHETEGNDMLYFTRLGLDTYYSTTETTMFTVPDLNEDGLKSKNGVYEEPEAKDFSVDASFTTDKYYKLKTYNYSNDSFYTDIIVKISDVSTATTAVYVFKGTSKVFNENDDKAVTAIKCLKAGAETTVRLNDGVETQIENQKLDFGDLFYITQDASGNASELKKAYDCSEMQFNNSGNNYWYYGTYSKYSDWGYRTGENNRNNLGKMWVYQKRGDAVFGSYEYEDLANDNYNEVIRLGSVPVVVVDTENKTIEKSNFDGISSYEEAGDAASLILVEERLHAASSVIIYK